MTEKTRQALPYISLVLAMLLWASSFVALKLAFRGYHPMQVIFGRMFIASLCFIVFIPAFRKIRWRRRDLKYLLAMAICEPCLYFLYEAKALELTSASKPARWVLTRDRVLTVASEITADAPNPMLGNFCEFLAMLCAAGYTVALKHLSDRFPPLFLTAFQAFLGSLFFFPFLRLPDIGIPRHLAATPLLAVVYLGTFITFGAYACYNFGVSRIPANQAAGFVNLIPVFSLLLGMLILGEKLNAEQWLACGFVFSGVWISSRRNARAVPLPMAK